MALARFARYLLQPLHGAPLALIVVFSLLGRLAEAGGLLGLPLDALLVCWLWSYAYALVDHTARGSPIPVLSIEMVNPWHEPRPFAQVALLAAAMGFAWWCELRGWHYGAIAVAACSIALFPASLAVLAVDGSVPRAVWPPALFAVVRGLGTLYLALILAALGACQLLVMAYGRTPTVVWYALLQTALLVLASALGGCLYERRDALGIEVWDSAERRAERRSRLDLRHRDRAVDEIYALIRARRLPEALAQTTQALGPAPVDPIAYRWLRDRAAQWDDRRIAERLTAELVSRLLALGRSGEAVSEVEGWWRQGGAFAPHAARDLDLLERAAAALGHAATRERLLAMRAATTTRRDDGRTPGS